MDICIYPQIFIKLTKNLTSGRVPMQVWADQEAFFIRWGR